MTVFASEEDIFFPAGAVLSRAREIFPNLVRAECLQGCRHVPSSAALDGVNDAIPSFLAAPAGV